ncbi:acyl carrier protein [Streptomyces sp. NPDC054794]
MPKCLPAAVRPTAIATLALATVVVGTPAAHGAGNAPAPDVPPQEAYLVTLSAAPTSTDFGHRTVDLTGTLSRADGTPMADAPVELGEGLMYNTWNPWGDPIDPTEWEARSLGTVRTDANGRFSLPGIKADRWQGTDSPLLSPAHEVEFDASYHPDPTDMRFAFARATVGVKTVDSKLTYRVNRTTVRPGVGLTVTGKVSWPEGHGPVAGTRVLLRTYWENEYNAQTTADAKGNFTIHTKIRSYDDTFVLFSAPKDYYIDGDGKALPVKNITRSR